MLMVRRAKAGIQDSRLSIFNFKLRIDFPPAKVDILVTAGRDLNGSTD
jgi:hypothetical protein